MVRENTDERPLQTLKWLEIYTLPNFLIKELGEQCSLQVSDLLFLMERRDILKWAMEPGGVARYAEGELPSGWWFRPHLPYSVPSYDGYVLIAKLKENE